MIHELDKAILKLKLTIAGHLSNINIKHENLEVRYLKLVKEVDALEKRIRDLEQDVSSIVYKSVKFTMILIGSIISGIYGIVNIIEFVIKAMQ
jgi:predicted  nucleic acid-binding Zn-ribbon protein